MAWVTPTDVNPGDAILASLYNQDVVANTNYLKAEADAVGLVHLDTTPVSAASTVSVNNVFSSDFLNYRIVFAFDASALTGTALSFRFRAAGSDNTASNYSYASKSLSAAGADVNLNGNGASSFQVMWTGFAGMAFSADVVSPQEATRTTMHGSGFGVNASGGNTLANVSWGGSFTANTLFDGFSFFVASGNLTGQLSVYGYGEGA